MAIILNSGKNEALLTVGRGDQQPLFLVGRMFLSILPIISLKYSKLASYFIFPVGLLTCWSQNITHTHRENRVKKPIRREKIDMVTVKISIKKHLEE